MSRKISLLTRAGSLEPEVDFTESPAPKRRTVRFAGLDSPSPTMTTGRRPKVGLGPIVSVSCVLWLTLGGNRRSSSWSSTLDSDHWLDRGSRANEQVFKEQRTTRCNFSSSVEMPPASLRCLDVLSLRLPTHNRRPLLSHTNLFHPQEPPHPQRQP